MSTEVSIWDVLGIAATEDARAIKRAYAKQLKTTRPEDDPLQFQILRQSYEYALARAEQIQREPAATESDSAPVAESAVQATISAASETAPAVPETAPAVAEQVLAPLAAIEPQAIAQEPPVDPQKQAQTLWLRFIGFGSKPDIKQLKVLLTSDELLNLEVRDYFELCAATWCASEQAEPGFASELIALFEWDKNISHLLRMDPHIPHTALARHYAENGWQLLCQKARTSGALNLLLNENPSSWPLQLMDRPFVRDIQEWIYTIRWKLPETLHYKVNQQRFEAWSNKCDGKRYFIQTFFASLAFSVPMLALWLALASALFGFDSVIHHDLNWLLPVLGVVSSYGMIGYLTFHPSGRLTRLRQYLVENLIQKPWWYLRDDWQPQLGLLLWFAVWSLSLILPDCPTWRSQIAMIALLPAVALMCLLMLQRVNSSLLSAILVLALSLAPSLQNAVTPYPYFVLCATFLFGLFSLLLQGCAGLRTWLTVPQLERARLLWLLAMAALSTNLMLTGSHILQYPAILALAWLLCVAGTQMLALGLSALTAWHSLLLPLLGYATFHYLNPVKLPFGPALVYYANIWFALMIVINLLSDRFVPVPKQET